jgi:hypothetical protein
MKMEVIHSSKMSVTTCNATPLTTEKATIYIFTTMKTLNLIKLNALDDLPTVHPCHDLSVENA